MTVENQIPYQGYTANGEQVDFALSFYVENKGNFFVKVNDAVVTVDDYSYNNLTNSIRFHTAPTKDSHIEVERVTSADRSVSYATFNNSFRPEVLNHDIDRIWRKLQELGYADSVLFLRLAKEIADRIAGDKNLQKQIDDLDIQVHKNTADIEDNKNQINELITNLSKEIADRIQADKILKEMFLTIVDEAINEGTVNALAIISVESVDHMLELRVWDGRIVYLKSFYTDRGEGGGIFIYDAKRAKENDTGTVFNGWVRLETNTLNPEMFGAKGDYVADESLIFKKLFEQSKTKPINVAFGKNKKYLIQTTQIIDGCKGITINGNGSTLMLGKNSTGKDICGLALQADPYATYNYNSLLKIENLVIDGIGSFYNPWQYFVDGKQWNTILGLSCPYFANIQLNNVTFKNIIGYGAQFFGFERFDANNLRFDNVGGHNGQWGNDSYGDCIYFGWRRNNSLINISNMTAYGVTQPEGTGQIGGSYYSSRSRICITIEHLHENTEGIKDKNTTVNLTNIYSRNYQRFLHSEANKGEIKVTAQNLDVLSDIIFLSSEATGGYALLDVKNSKLHTDTANYNGTGGINWGFSGTISNCDISDEKNKTLTDGLLAHQGNATVYLRDCNIYARSLLGNSSASKVTVEGGTLKHQFLNGYHSYGMTNPIQFKNVKISFVDTAAFSVLYGVGGASFEFDGCTFENCLARSQDIVGLTNKFYFDSTNPKYLASYKDNRAGYVYVDKALVRTPYKGILGLISTANQFVSSVNQTIPALTEIGSSFSYALDKAILLENYGNEFYVIIASRIQPINVNTLTLSTAYANGGYIIKYVYDSVNAKYVPTITKAIGSNMGSASEITIDTVNMSFKRHASYGNYANYGLVVFLKKSQLDEFYFDRAIEQYTTAQLTAITHTCNLYDKFFGKEVFNTTINKFMKATGSNTNSTWISTDAVTTITPV